MQKFVIPPIEAIAGPLGWLTACFILSDWSRLPVLLLSSIIVPSFLFMGLAWALNVSLLGMHKEPAL